jgi:hypothetical protein
VEGSSKFILVLLDIIFLYFIGAERGSIKTGYLEETPSFRIDLPKQSKARRRSRSSKQDTWPSLSENRATNLREFSNKSSMRVGIKPFAANSRDAHHTLPVALPAYNNIHDEEVHSRNARLFL